MRPAAVRAPATLAANAPERVRVLVVGGGFAGLAAAAALQAGLPPGDKVVVLEAGRRVGGRAWTAPLGGGVDVEMGATWLHGLGTPADGPNPVFEEAVAAGLVPPDAAGTRWWSSRFVAPGRPEPLGGREEIAAHAAVEAFAAALEAASAAGASGDGGGASLGALLDAAAARRAAAGDVALDAAAAAAWAWRERLQHAIDGVDDTHDLSAEFYAQYSEMGDANVPIPGGFGAVAAAMARRHGLDVRLGHEVRRLEWGAAGVDAACAGGAAFAADAAVVTVSLGVLKARHAELFSPPLPAATAAAIDRLKIGTVDKLVVVFGEESEGGGPAAAAAAAAAADGRPWRGVAPADGGVVSYSLLWPADALGTPPGRSVEVGGRALPWWARGVFSLRFGGPEFKRAAGAAAGAPPHCLVAWVTGAEARAIASAPDAEVLAALRGVAAAFPGAALPRGARWGAARLVRSRWGADPAFRGSYSYVGAGAPLADVAALAAPLAAGGRPVLALAGEAAHTRYMGTAHGAALSGRRAAAALLGGLRGGGGGGGGA